MGSDKSINKTVKDFAESTTTHGISHILSDRSLYTRIVWIMLTLSSLGVLLHQLGKITISFTERTTLTSYEKKQVGKLKFPTVTICGSSILRRSAIPWADAILTDSNASPYYLSSENLMALRALLAVRYFSVFDTLEAVKRASLDPHKLFLTNFTSSCIFGIHNLCTYEKNITDLITSSYGGMCFQFNSKGLLNQLDAGSYYGLSLILYLNQSDYVPFLSFDTGGGLVVKIHQVGEFPFPEDDGILVSPGHLTRISLKKFIFHRLEYPYPSNCTDGKGFDLFYPGLYSLSNCKRSCVVQDSLDACQTTDPLTSLFLNKTGKYKYHKANNTMLQCVYNAASVSTSTERKPCVCPVPCKEETFRPTKSQSKWPSESDLPLYRKAFAYALKVNTSLLTNDYIYNNFIHLNIFFDEMSYEQITEKPEWSPEKLLSDIGGQMGIWLGASILSLFELVIFIGKVLKRLLLSKRSQKVENISPK